MDNLEKKYDTSSIPHPALCIISNPSVNSNWNYSPKTLNSGLNRWFFSGVTSKFDEWPWNSRGYLFYATLSFVHHFKAMGEFKLELQPGNAQFGSKSAIFLVPCDLEIWQMTLKNNRAPLLCCLKFCALFHSHQWMLTGVTVRKRQNWVKIDVFFCPVWPWNLRHDLEKQKGTYSMLC